MTGMKLVSPLQRGTRCRWRCSTMPAPAALPRLTPMLKPSGFMTVLRAARPLDQFQQVQQLFIDQLGEVADLSVGHNHEVAAVVRIVVEQGEAAAVARDHVVSDIVVRLGDLGEEADFRGRWFGRQDVLDSPRGVETFHAAKLEGQCGKVKAAVDSRFAIADIANRKSNIPCQAACFFWTSRLRST